MWVDASGVERGLGALMFDGNKFEYCHCTLPQDVWEQLNPRGDHNIGSQEMLAAVMGLHTWKDKFAGHCLSFFGDNAGVVGPMIRGSSNARETNALTGRMWMHVACDDIAIMIYRVKSESNPADGPSRGKFDLMLHLCAEDVAPKFHPWAYELWSIPSIL